MKPAELNPRELSHLLEFAAGLDLTVPDAARAALEAEFPFYGEYVAGIAETMRRMVRDGTLCNRGVMPVRWSRAFKSDEDPMGFSADAVLMNAAGPMHVHPNGEIDLCFVEEGAPTFDGHAPGWVVFPPGSRHVPTVAGGTMLILYLLPGGAIEFAKSN